MAKKKQTRIDNCEWMLVRREPYYMGYAVRTCRAWFARERLLSIYLGRWMVRFRIPFTAERST